MTRSENVEVKNLQAKPSMCVNCIHVDRDCSHLSLESMPILSVTGDMAIVDCTDFVFGVTTGNKRGEAAAVTQKVDSDFPVGRNEHGLDVEYFKKAIARELNDSSLEGYTPEQLAGIFWRLAMATDRSIFDRQNASIIRSLKFPVVLRKMWSGGEVQAWLEEQAELHEQQ